MYVFVYLCIMERTHLIREHLFAKGPCIWSIKVASTRGGWNAYIQRTAYLQRACAYILKKWMFLREGILHIAKYTCKIK